jgi:hypothetical protein
MDIVVATPYEVAGYIDDARTQLAIAEEGTFFYAKDTNYAMYSHDFSAVMTGRETSPLEDARIVLELGARHGDVDKFSYVPKHAEAKTKRIGLSESDDELVRAQKRDERTQMHEASMQKSSLTRYAQVVDADGPLERQTMLLRAAYDARKLAPNAPVTLASPYELERGFHGKLLGRHDTSATLLVDRGQRGAAVVAIGRDLLPNDSPLPPRRNHRRFGSGGEPEGRTRGYRSPAKAQHSQTPIILPLSSQETSDELRI